MKKCQPNAYLHIKREAKGISSHSTNGNWARTRRSSRSRSSSGSRSRKWGWQQQLRHLLILLTCYILLPTLASSLDVRLVAVKFPLRVLFAQAPCHTLHTPSLATCQSAAVWQRGLKMRHKIDKNQLIVKIDKLKLIEAAATATRRPTKWL